MPVKSPPPSAVGRYNYSFWLPARSWHQDAVRKLATDGHKPSFRWLLLTLIDAYLRGGVVLPPHDAACPCFGVRRRTEGP